MATIYLASPYGFTEATRTFLDGLKRSLRQTGHVVHDPWETGPAVVARYATRVDAAPVDRRTAILHEMDSEISEANKRLIENSDIIVAGLDGPDVDSGTASEIGYAFAKGKKIFGYRGDFRRTGENDGMLINPQVQYWIEASGGAILQSLLTVEQAIGMGSERGPGEWPTAQGGPHIPPDTRDASKEALKTTYRVIIGLAIAQSLNQTFLRNNTFIGLQILTSSQLPSLFLLLAFVPTIVRFAHGASIHLAAVSGGKYKPLVDFSGFFLQGILFYLMALSLSQPLGFAYFFLLLLFGDAVWLLFLWAIRYTTLNPRQGPTLQWVASDALLIVLIVAVVVVDPPMTNLWSAVVVFLAAWVATGVDYYQNREFYFPSESTG